MGYICTPADLPSFPLNVVFQEDMENLIFRNQIKPKEGSADPREVISRASHDVRIEFSCVYPRKWPRLGLEFEHKSPRVFTWKDNGAFSLQFEFYETEHFRYSSYLKMITLLDYSIHQITINIFMYIKKIDFT